MTTKRTKKKYDPYKSNGYCVDDGILLKGSNIQGNSYTFMEDLMHDKRDNESIKGIISETGDSSIPRTKTAFWYDLRKLNTRNKKSGRETSTLWMLLFLWVGMVFYIGLGVLLWLVILDIGWVDPLFYMVYHACLFGYFLLLFISSAYSFTQERLLEDNLRPAAISGVGSITNLISFVSFLTWICNNTSLIFDIDYDKDPKETLGFENVASISFTLFVLFCIFWIGAYITRYIFAKFIEVMTMTIRQLEKNTTGRTLKEVLITSAAFLNENVEDLEELEDCESPYADSSRATLLKKKQERNIKKRAKSKRQKKTSKSSYSS